MCLAFLCNVAARREVEKNGEGGRQASERVKQRPILGASIRSLNRSSALRRPQVGVSMRYRSILAKDDLPEPKNPLTSNTYSNGYTQITSSA